MKKILLVDANLLLFRSFYAALAISKNPNNMPTHLFFNTVLEILKKEDPEYVLFAFDAYGKTKRQEEFKEYKLGRTKAPDELYEQKDIIKKILEKMKFKWYEKVGDEADDIIATVCEKYKKENLILILSEDKDLLQLVDLNVLIILKNRNKNEATKYKKINIDNFFTTYNFLPNQVVDYKAIAGDSSDNLSGIKGVGPKGAINLLNQYKSLENIYLNIEKLTEKVKTNFLSQKDHAFMCKKLATLNKNVDLDFDLNEMFFDKKNLVDTSVVDILNENKLKRTLESIQKWNGN